MEHFILFKRLILIGLLLTFFYFSHAQVSIFPDGVFSECPGEYIVYTVEVSPNYSNVGCQFEWTVTNGTFNNNSTTIIGNPVSVKWDNTADIGKLNVEVFSCNVSVINGNYPSDDITIKSIANVTPQAINGASNVPVYPQNNPNYSTAKINYPNTGGQGQPQAEEVDSYQWVIPLGWKLGSITSDGSTPITNQSRSITVIPDDCGGDGSKIKVRGYSSCGPGYTSKWQELTINRTLPALSFSQAPPNFIVCEDTNPITVSVASVAGATSYTWTKPSGWSGSSTSNSITLTPNGTTAGTISVKANVCGQQTTALAKTVTIELYSPGNSPTISGPSQVCTSSSTYSVLNAPPNTIITWTKSVNLAYVSGQGTNNYTVKAAPAASGDGWIEATLQTTCGSNLLVRKTLSVAYGGAGISVISGPSTVCTATQAWHATLPPGGTSITWDYDHSLFELVDYGTPNTVIALRPIGNWTQYTTAWISAIACGPCGCTPYPSFKGDITRNCSSGYYTYSVSPNPSTSSITVQRNSSRDSNITEKMALNTQIKIYDSSNGSLVNTYQIDKEEFIIDTQNYKRGKYIIHITENNEIISIEQLIFE